MKIRDILKVKGYEVVTVPPNLTVQDVMRLLVKHNIGSVVVVEGDDVLGILTERDVLRLGADDPTRLKTTRAEEAMTRDVMVGIPEDTVEYVMEIMTRNRIRHLPIVEDGWLQGIVSIGDIVNALHTSVQAENRHLKDYIYGKA